jgi:hypothetical protein
MAKKYKMVKIDEKLHERLLFWQENSTENNIVGPIFEKALMKYLGIYKFISKLNKRGKIEYVWVDYDDNEVKYFSKIDWINESRYRIGDFELYPILEYYIDISDKE